MLEQLRLHSEARGGLAIVIAVAHILEHQVERSKGSTDGQFVQESARAGLGNAVCQRAGVDSGSGHDTRVRRVLGRQFVVAEPRWPGSGTVVSTMATRPSGTFSSVPRGKRVPQ